LFDYGGFPEVSYTYKYPAPSSPELVEKIQAKLSEAKFPKTIVETNRGYDHGIFVPLMLMYPFADIPIVAVSIVHNNKRDYDPLFHYELGRALGPLREEGVLIFGSGLSYHNMGGFFGYVKTVKTDS
jgi:aromatic ring-opening dioxygenase catalytic subunit (LigB family)